MPALFIMIYMLKVSRDVFILFYNGRDLFLYLSVRLKEAFFVSSTWIKRIKQQGICIKNFKS